MADHVCENALYSPIDPSVAVMLRLLVEPHSQREIADQVGVSVSAVARVFAELRDATGSRSAGELARWWTTHRAAWTAELARVAGVELGELSGRTTRLEEVGTAQRRGP